jgi:hypothetical protein
MRPAWITGAQTLQTRLAAPMQVAAPTAEAEMPAYMESFLGHLRLLIGVPFDYLVPDARLLPDESIRFFYIDRSWTDRLVDGAISVGKIGSREQAHHQAHAAGVGQQLDITERGVRDLQRNKYSFLDWRSSFQVPGAAQVTTGFLLRSGAVSGWPHMDVRAYSKVLPRNYDPAAPDSIKYQLRTLRLERLSPGVLIALFEGVPTMVVCEEPHHGIQFGVHETNGVFSVFRRDATAEALVGETKVPVRTAKPRVLGIAALRRRLAKDAALPPQTGSASFAIELLNLPFRQRFGGEDIRYDLTGTGAFVANVAVAPQVTQAELQTALQGFAK